MRNKMLAVLLIALSGMSVAKANASISPEDKYYPAEKIDGFTTKENHMFYKGFLNQKSQAVLFYIKVAKNCNTYIAPIQSKKLISDKVSRGDVFPVFGIIGTASGIFYRIGESLFIKKINTEIDTTR